MMWDNGYSMGWVMWLVMGLGVLGFWVVIALVVRALLPGRAARTGTPAGPDPLSVLKDRLARGELTVEEYEQRRRLIVDGH